MFLIPGVIVGGALSIYFYFKIPKLILNIKIRKKYKHSLIALIEQINEYIPQNTQKKFDIHNEIMMNNNEKILFEYYQAAHKIISLYYSSQDAQDKIYILNLIESWAVVHEVYLLNSILDMLNKNIPISNKEILNAMQLLSTPFNKLYNDFWETQTDSLSYEIKIFEDVKKNN